ncbi:MAG TPA: carboxypeptidase regulatory-like domain-containing protein [Methanocella sp.]|uniref:peptidase MA family metallohydrolase n=1 Tax=Methanocella sp. TaxID=2052833 RepID=UPI002B8BA5FF|nr:carboxypeptidase regulatory-like domain-containing protein [Methanocella sp.]HTY92121.1 carboxypeptidase regulatory-like domain-containing protein [Methanocella sp.]
MRSIPTTLGYLALVIIILSAASPSVSATSMQYAPPPPGDFMLYKSDHFDIYYDSTRITDVSGVVMAANAAYANVTAFYGSYDYHDRIILASSHEQYANILLNYLTNENISESNVASAWGDADSGTIVIEVPDQLPNFTTVLTHQFAEIVLRTRLISNKYTVPAWFSEGLAIFISGDLSDSGKALVEDACRNGKMMTVAQMNEILSNANDPSVSPDEAKMAEAQSGMLMQYIAQKYGADSLNLIIQDYGSLNDLDKSFMRHLGYGPEGINIDWQNELKGELNIRDGIVTSENAHGYVTDAGGKPIANQTITFTCMRNDSAVLGKIYTATTNSSGFYSLNLTYGLFKVQIHSPGYADLLDSITLQKGELRLYNITLANAETVTATPIQNMTQNVAANPEAADNSLIYMALGAVNVLAILLIAFIFLRVRK